MDYEEDRYVTLQVPVSLYWFTVADWYRSNGLPIPDPDEWARDSRVLEFLANYLEANTDDIVGMLVEDIVYDKENGIS